MKWLSLIVFCLLSWGVQDFVYSQEKVVINPSGDASKTTQKLDAEPTDLASQLKVAQNLFNQGESAEAWQILRGLYDKSPTEPGVLAGIEALINGYKLQGRLNVGTLEKSVVELLGQPHQAVKMPWGVRLVYGAIAVDFRDGKVYEQVNLLGATEDLFNASHVIDVDLGSSPSWHVGVRQKGSGLTTAFLFPPDQSIGRWTELVTIERFVGAASGNTLSRVLERAQEQIKATDPSAKVIIAEQDESTVIFAVNYPARDNLIAKQQLVRLWMGKQDVHRLAYTHQGNIPSEQEGKRWFAVIKNAELKPYDPSVSRTSKEFEPHNQVKKLAEAIRSDLKNAGQYKPTPAALAAIAATEEDKAKLLAYCEKVYKEFEQGGQAARSNQTEIRVFGPKIEDLPGGYSSARKSFKADANFYGFKYIAPGETSGMSFDGAFAVEGKWYFLPKVHRAFK